MKAFSKSEKKILLALLSILLILSTLAVLSYRNNSEALGSADQIDRLQESKFHIEQLLAVSSDLETGARGYIITGDETYLEPTNKAIATIFRHIDNLKTLYAGDSEKIAVIKELEELIEQKVNTSTRAIEIRRNKGLSDAINYVSSGNGRQLMDKIRQLASRMLDDENVQLNLKKEENKINVSNFNLAFYLLLVKIMITILAVFFVLSLYFRHRRAADQLLKESHRLMQTIIDNTTSVISIKDLAGRYILINRQYEQLFHISKEEIKGKTDHDIFPYETAERLRNADLEVVRHKKLIEFEEDIPHHEETRHYHTVKFPLFDNHMHINGVCGVATDITERKRSEQLLKERSNVILDLFNNAPCGYHSLNSEGIIIEMNDTELKWLGYTREEMTGKLNITNILSEESKLIFNYHFPKLKERVYESLHDVEERYMRKDKTIFPVTINAVASYDSEGNLLNIRVSVMDITARKQAEAIYTQN